MSVDSSTYISSDGSVKESSLVAIRTPDIPNTETSALAGFYSDITAAIQATSSNMDTLQDMAIALLNQQAKTSIISRSQGLGQQYVRFGLRMLSSLISLFPLKMITTLLLPMLLHPTPLTNGLHTYMRRQVRTVK